MMWAYDRRTLAASVAVATVCFLLGAVGTLQQRRERLATLSAAEQQELAQRMRAFRAASPDEREHARALQEGLERAGADQDDLEAALLRYWQWRDSLTAAQRRRIDAASSNDARLAAVEAVLDEQAAAVASTISQWKAEWQRGMRGPSDFGFGGRFEPLASRLGERVAKLATPAEQRALQDIDALSWSRMHQMTFLCAVARKYGVDIGVEPIDRGAYFVLRGLYEGAAESLQEELGKQSYSDLDEEERKRFHTSAVAIFLLPQPPPERIVETVIEPDARLKEEYASLPESRRRDFLRSLVPAYYRKADEARQALAPEMRQAVLDFVDPAESGRQRGFLGDDFFRPRWGRGGGPPPSGRGGDFRRGGQDDRGGRDEERRRRPPSDDR